MMRGWRPPAALALAAATLAGCGYEGASSLPLPGAIEGKDTYAVTVVLDDATNLVPKETCRSNDTIVGSVESVTLDDQLQAKVVCRIKKSVKLPANAVGTLRETSLLGERFVGLDPAPGQQPRGVLEHGVTLPAASTRVDPNVEMVLGALSQVLNGGSLGKIETITRELNTALEESDVSGTIRDLGPVIATLNDHRVDITTSLVSLDRLARKLARQRRVIAGALDSIPGGLRVLDRQRPKLVATLRSLSRLSRVALPLIRKTKANTVADLKHLAPVLSRLTEAGDELALTVERVASFPFPSNAQSAIAGDYGGFYGTAEIDIDVLNQLLGGPVVPTQTGPGQTPDTPGQPELPGVPEIPGLPEVPGLPAIPGLPELLTGPSGSSPDRDALDLGDLLGGGR